MPEPQYQGYADLPRERLGLRANVWWQTDPRSLLFSMARYQFVAKMLAGHENVLEVGCGDAFCTRLVQCSVRHITAIDFDPEFIKDARERQALGTSVPVMLATHNILAGRVYARLSYTECFDAAYAIDVLEHIAPENEHTFLKNICDSLSDDGVLILGTPSKESQAYASEGSKAGHVNCHTGPELTELMRRYFQTVFPFSMNDTAIYPGFSPMARYYFVIGAGKVVS